MEWTRSLSEIDGWDDPWQVAKTVVTREDSAGAGQDTGQKTPVQTSLDDITARNAHFLPRPEECGFA